MQAYSDPQRESEPTALPDLEVWEHDCTNTSEPCPFNDEQLAEYECERGWYWQACFPGCLPDGEPNGPFETREEALADAREGLED